MPYDEGLGRGESLRKQAGNSRAVMCYSEDHDFAFMFQTEGQHICKTMIFTSCM